MIKKRFFWIFLLILTFLPSQVWGFGISPTPILKDNLANGVRVESTVTILNSNSNKTAEIEVSVNGDGARYIELPEDSFLMPGNEDQHKYSFYIAPKNAPNGKHEAMLLFVKKAASSDNGGGSGAVLQEAVGARVIFTVTDKEVVEVRVGDVNFDSIEVGIPLNFSYYLQNFGNVDTRLNRVELAVVDITDPEHKYEKVFTSNDLEILAPGEANNFSLSLGQTLPQGVYNASLVFYLKDEEVFRNDKIKIEVLPPGSLGQGAELVDFYSPREVYNKGELAEFFGVIKNTGDIGLQTTFFVEIYKGEQRVDLVRSKDVYILKGSDSNFKEYFRFEEYGEYSVKGYFEYGSGRTETKEILISVPEPASSKAGSLALYLVISGVLLIIVVIVIIIWLKKRGKKQKTKNKSKKRIKKKTSPKNKKTNKKSKK